MKPAAAGIFLSNSIMISYPDRLDLARTPTPLEPLHAFFDQFNGTRLWVKRDDLTGSVLSGNKVRKLEFVIAHAKKNGADTLITCGGLQSNHCRATALVGAQLGMKVHLMLRAEGNREVDGNLLLDYIAGATVEIIPKNDYVKNLDELLIKKKEAYAEQGRTAHIIPTGASDEIGIWGYVACAGELSTDFREHAIAPEVIVCATGSGGTQAGLSLGGFAYSLAAKVIGYAVCDSSQYFNDKARSDIRLCVNRYGLAIDPESVNVSTVDDYIGPGYAKGYPELYDCIRYVATRTGLVLDPVYTGKAFYGLLTDLKKGVYRGARDIVFVHTGGTFGLFAHKQEFQLPAPTV